MTPQKKKREPFKPGERVKFYGAYHNYFPPHQSGSSDGRKGEVVNEFPSGTVHVRPDGHDHTFHVVLNRRQCVRLIPKPRKREAEAKPKLVSLEALQKAFDNTPLSMDHFERMEICDAVWERLK